VIDTVPQVVDLRRRERKPLCMTVIALPTHGRWAWDARGDGRAVRVSTHPALGLLNLSIWRDDVCVGTVRLAPEDAAGLINGLSEGLAELAVSAPPGDPAADAARFRELEQRLVALEQRPRGWRRAVDAVVTWAGRAPAGR
jgi:hypothetical protein